MMMLAMLTGAYQVPRPPPVRPSEVLEQLGFKVCVRAHPGGFQSEGFRCWSLPRMWTRI
jgi:hypothetical protein